MTDNADPIAALEQRAANDSEFREALLQDPRAAIDSALNVTIPGDWEVVARVDEAGNVRIGFVDDRIPDEYLDLVSGGVTFDFMNPQSRRAIPSC